MDFAYAHGADRHINALRAMFPLRATTTLVSARGVNAIRPLINHLDKTAAIIKPIGDIVLGAHANEEGQLFMPVVPGQVGPTRFETLEETLKKPKHSIAIPDTVIGFTPGSQVTHAVHIKGCNIGNALPFLQKLKEALGGHVQVTAPKFFHGATPEPEGAFEYVGYQFALKRTKRFKDRKEALTEFDAAQFQLTNGTSVDQANWNAVIPKDPNMDTRDGADPFEARRHDRQADDGQHSAAVSRRPDHVRSVAHRLPAGRADPEDEVGAALGPRDVTRPGPALQTRATRSRSSRGKDSPTSSSSCRATTGPCSPRGRSLFCFGTRLLYIIVMAVTDPEDDPDERLIADGNLVFNFYPAAGSTIPAKTTALQVTNPTFFTTV